MNETCSSNFDLQMETYTEKPTIAYQKLLLPIVAFPFCSICNFNNCKHLNYPFRLMLIRTTYPTTYP